ncbi:MAG: shikimate kinase [Thermoanaerobacteraceae bacterium]|nr:shikimate kinase [Thermoanaerobacteraceae bacterium]
MPGSGKTSVGKILAKYLGMDFCDVDKYIEKIAGKTIPEIFKEGEKHFRALERAAIEELSQETNAVIATGGGVVLFSQNMENLKRKGLVFFINRPIGDIVKDIDISNRPLLANDINRIYQLFRERYELYKKYSDFEIKSQNEIMDTVKKIIKVLEERNFL